MSTNNQSAAAVAVKSSEQNGENIASRIGHGLQDAVDSSNVQAVDLGCLPENLDTDYGWGFHRSAIYRLALCRFNDFREDVEDILQDTYVKYWHSKGRMPSENDFGHLAHILKQVGVDYVRRRDAGKRQEKMADSLEQLALGGYEPVLESRVEFQAESVWIEEKIRAFRVKCVGKRLICFEALVERSFGKVEPRVLDEELGELAAIFGLLGKGKKTASRRHREISRVVGIVRLNFRQFCRSDFGNTPLSCLAGLRLMLESNQSGSLP